ncbi:MAG: cytochrome c oxidase assembly protein, partial [Microbacteriaceae bacterium]
MPRVFRILAPGLVALFSFGALYLALVVGGGADPLAILDPGPIVRWGAPTARLLNDIGFTVTLGALAVAAFALSKKLPEFRRAIDIAAMGAVFWTISALATGFFSFMSMSGLTPASGEMFNRVFLQFFSEIPVGQLYLFIVIVAATVSILCFMVQSYTGLFWALLLTIVGIYPFAEMGHAAGGASHDVAVTGLLLHLLGAAVWMGGLATIAFLAYKNLARLHIVLRRFSALALLCFLVVAYSGAASAIIRVGSLENLFNTEYGWLVIGKVFLITVLAFFGLLQRNWVLGKMARAEKTATVKAWFWYIIVTELAFMGAAAGTGTALARTKTPIDDTPPSGNVSPAEYLTGEPLPPVPSPENFLLVWRLDLLWMLVAVLAIVWYLWGVIRLRKRGDTWPWLRTVSFISGMVIFFYSTNGALNAYERYLFSVHMMEHMTL